MGILARGLDHVVWAVRDIDAASRFLEGIGFTLTPLARHPWGTVNRLIQLNGFFIELLSVGDEALIPDAGNGAFSFGAFNRDFLKQREGGSMLVMESRDPDDDRQAFEKAGLPTFKPFSFERIAKSPDGSERKVAFDLTFTRDEHAPDIGFFTCHHRFPENFWQERFQKHPNSVNEISAAVIAVAEPADHHIFYSAFTGVRETRTTSLGIEIATPRGDVDLFTPAGYRALYGDANTSSAVLSPSIAAIRMKATDRGTLEACLRGAGVNHYRSQGGLVIPAEGCFGLSLIFD
ncbi:VOC family protein [Stappia sp. GBMRC 2046]|uniref:VOC family protein n=1 Tax=Stappia sediminis TaxID=2692190 RepID=A0A7X3LXP8_9HYPH|nr:VOC family protein [Stappia sediminis]MXN66997.1 VOC family protein [Stappia sediminis]